MGDAPTIQSCSAGAGGVSVVAPPMDSSSCNSDVTAPCFASVDDILAGRRHLLRNDDLVLSAGLHSDSTGGTSLRNLILETENVAVSKVITQTLSKDCSNPVSAVGVGRLFSQPTDTIVTLSTPLASLCGTTAQFTLSDTSGTIHTQELSTPLVGGTIVLADFNLDGYDDIFFINRTFLQAFTATCTGDPFAGCTPSSALSSGPQESVGANAGHVGGPVVGDFNADGVMDVAWAGRAGGFNATTSIFLASVCPDKGVTVLGQTCSQPLETIRAPSSFAITKAGPGPTVALAADVFSGSVDAQTGRPDTELLVALQLQQVNSATVTAYKFDENLKATQASTPLTIESKLTSKFL